MPCARTHGDAGARLTSFLTVSGVSPMRCSSSPSAGTPIAIIVAPWLAQTQASGVKCDRRQTIFLRDTVQCFLMLDPDMLDIVPRDVNAVS